MFIGIVMIAVLLMGFGIRCASGATYYVDPTNGNDANDGSSVEEAFKTLAKANTLVNPNDRVNLMAGDYGSVTWGAGARKGSAGNWIEYQSYPDDGDAVFRCIYLYVCYNAYMRFSGIDVNVVDQTDGAVSFRGASYVDINECTIHGVAGEIVKPAYLVKGVGASDVNIVGCTLYNGQYGIDAMTAPGFTTATDWLVAHNHIHDIVASGVRTGAPPMTVEYNVIHDQREDWYPAAHGSGISIHRNEITVRGNVIYNYGNSRPIYFYANTIGDDGYHDMLIENNVVYRTPDYVRTMWWVDLHDCGDNVVVRNNTFERSCQIFFAKNSDGTGVSVYNNVFYGNLAMYRYCTSLAALNDDTYEQAVANWFNVLEGGNFYHGLTSRWVGLDRDVTITDIWPQSTSVKDATDAYWAQGTFFQATSGDYPYQLCEGSAAISAADIPNAPDLDVFEFDRGLHPDSGAYEFGAAPPPPNPAVNPYPGNHASSTNAHPVLNWVDPDGLSAIFDVWFGTDPEAMVKASDDQAASSYDPGRLAYGQTYYWQIVSDDVVDGPVWDFTVKQQPVWFYWGGW